MPNKRTSLHLSLINTFGEANLIAAKLGYETIIAPSDIMPITNPVARFLKGTTYVKYSSLYSSVRMTVPSEDFMYFKLASGLVKRLKPEIDANPSYKDQVMKKLFHRQFGPMLSALNELMAAAYYKHLDLEVTLNSSEQTGSADVDITNTNYASDAKLYPNNHLRLEAIVNESAEQLLKSVQKIQDSNLLFFILKPDKKLLHAAMVELDEFLGRNENLSLFKNEVLHVTLVDNSYKAADYSIHISKQNVNIFIQQNWPLDDSVEEMKLSILKATKQADEVGKMAIPWIMVPGDAKRHGITTQVLRHVAGFHSMVQDNKSIFVMPVFSFGFEGTGFTTIFDVYQTGTNTLNINGDTFQEFMKGIMNDEVIEY